MRIVTRSIIRRVLCIGLMSVAFAPLSWAAQSERETKANPDITAVRHRLIEFENAFNRNDVNEVAAQYDPRLVAILLPNFMGYNDYLRAVWAVMADPGHPQIHLEVHTALVLADGVVVLNGRANTKFLDGRELRDEVFTLIYTRTNGIWKIIYSHSP